MATAALRVRVDAEYHLPWLFPSVMPILSEPRCPVCGASVSLRPLWQAAQREEHGILEKKTGITCPICSRKLRVLQGRCGAATIVKMLVYIAAPFLVFASGIRTGLYVGLALAALAAFALEALFHRMMPLLATLREAREGEELDYPLEWKAADAITPENSILLR